MPIEAVKGYDLTMDPMLRRRVEILMVPVCAAVLAENPATPNHNDRAVYARTALMNLAKEAERITTIVVAISVAIIASPATLTDKTVKDAITAHFDTLAGVSQIAAS